MILNTTRIIASAERILTLAKRAIVSDDRDSRRDQIIVEFGAMATDAGMIAIRIGQTNWGGIVMAAYDLHTSAVTADERRSGTFTHLGSETALLTTLHGFAAVLGFGLADAATADEPHDDAARSHVEHLQEARHAAE